eukprot:2587204-Rhodomonas_salina.2
MSGTDVLSAYAGAGRCPVLTWEYGATRIQTRPFIYPTTCDSGTGRLSEMSGTDVAYGLHDARY